MANFYVGKRRAKQGEIAAECRASSLMLNHASRSLRQTDAQPRRGKHARLSPEERGRREADRVARQRVIQRRKETFAELAEQRAARKRVREEEAWLKRKTIRVKVPKEERSKVTWNGGRRHYRQRTRFERAVLPPWRNTSFSRSALVWRIKSRSLGGEGRGRYRRHECANFGRYLVNEIALELSPEEAIFTSIVPKDVPRDSDAFTRELTTFLVAAEDLEREIDPVGQLYKSIIVPLPHDISADRRREIAGAYARQFDRHELPYLLVLHAPDPGGDQRNYHLHALVLTRAFERTDGYDWAFARTKSRDVFHPSMLKVWRRYTVNLFNHHLAEARIARRYTLRAAEPAGQHQGRIRTFEGRKRVIEAEGRVVAAERQRDRSGVVLGLADAFVAMARRHAEIGRTTNRARAIVLKRLNARSVAAGDAIDRQRSALHVQSLLADVRRRAMALRERRDRFAMLVPIATLRRNLAAHDTDMATNTRRLDNLSRRAVIGNLAKAATDRADQVQTARAVLGVVARRAGQREQLERTRHVARDAVRTNAKGRLLVVQAVRKVITNVGAGLRDAADRSSRSRAILTTTRQAGLRGQASSLRDTLAIARMNVELARLNRPAPPAKGIMAQAARISATAPAPQSTYRQRSIAIGPRPIAEPEKSAVPASPRGTPIDLFQYDATIRDLPASRVSTIATELGDLRAAIRSGRVQLYRIGPDLRVVTDDHDVRAVIARILADPAGKTVLLSIGASRDDEGGGRVSRAPSQADRERLQRSSPTAVPSLMPKSPPRVASVSALDLDRFPIKPAVDCDQEPDNIHIGSNRGGAER